MNLSFQVRLFGIREHSGVIILQDVRLIMLRNSSSKLFGNHFYSSQKDEGKNWQQKRMVCNRLLKTMVTPPCIAMTWPLQQKAIDIL